MTVKDDYRQAKAEPSAGKITIPSKPTQSKLNYEQYMFDGTATQSLLTCASDNCRVRPIITFIDGHQRKHIKATKASNELACRAMAYESFRSEQLAQSATLQLEATTLENKSLRYQFVDTNPLNHLVWAWTTGTGDKELVIINRTKDGYFVDVSGRLFKHAETVTNQELEQILSC